MTNKWGTVKLFTFSFGIDPPNIISCAPKIFSCAPKNVHFISNFLSSGLQMDHGFLTGQSWCVHKTCHIAAGFSTSARWPAKFAGYFTSTCHLLFFGNYPSFYKWNEKRFPQNTNFGGKTKVLPKLWVAFIVQSSKPNTLLSSLAPKTTVSGCQSSQTCAQISMRSLVLVFSFSPYSKAFATYLKPCWKPCS